MSKKWYNYIVSVDDAAGTEQDRSNSAPNAKSASAGAKSAAQSAHATVYAVGSAGPRPAIAFRNAPAPVRVSARKNTHPTITTIIRYT